MNPIQALVDGGRVTPPSDLQDLIDLFNQRVSRSRTDRRRLRHELALASAGQVIDIRDLFRMKEAWTNQGLPSVAISHIKRPYVEFINGDVYVGDDRLSGVLGFAFQKAPRKNLKHVVSIPQIGPGRVAAGRYRTAVPLIPKDVLPWNPLVKRNSFVLFDSPAWAKQQDEVVPDPYLLQRMDDSRFKVLAHWDLSPKERQLMALLSD